MCGCQPMRHITPMFCPSTGCQHLTSKKKSKPWSRAKKATHDQLEKVVVEKTPVICVEHRKSKSTCVSWLCPHCANSRCGASPSRISVSSTRIGTLFQTSCQREYLCTKPKNTTWDLSFVSVQNLYSQQPYKTAWVLDMLPSRQPAVLWSTPRDSLWPVLPNRQLQQKSHALAFQDVAKCNLEMRAL